MLIAFPSHDLIWDAEILSPDIGADVNYGLSNLQDNDPANIARFDGVTATIEIDLDGVSATPVALLLANTNAMSGTFSNTGALSEALTFPSRTPDGKQRNGWLDLRGISGVADDTFTIDLAKTGSAELELGRICLVTALQAPEVLVQGAGSPPVYGVRRPGQVEQMTRLGTTHRSPSPVHAPRRITLTTLTKEAKDILEPLSAECLGLNRGFLLIPNDDLNDAWFAQCEMVDFEHQQDHPDTANDITPSKMTLLEMSMGAPPALT